MMPLLAKIIKRNIKKQMTNIGDVFLFLCVVGIFPHALLAPLAKYTHIHSHTRVYMC